MGDTNGRLMIRDLRGGRNGVDPPQSLSDRQCQEAVNVDWWNASFCRKRGGVTLVSLSGGGVFSGVIASMFRHVPAQDETAAELWASDTTPSIGRLTAGTAWASPTLKDAPTGNGWDFTYTSLNGKLFIAYKSSVDRLHVWDPVSASVRRTGLAAMAAPTVGNTGSGSYAAVLRYYRTRATVQVSSVTVRRSEPTAGVSFTPSGSGTSARVTQGTPPSEGETHWEVEASLDNATFYRIATVAIGTTTYDDSAATTTYASNTVSASVGTYTLQTSYKFIAADQGRLLGFGNYTSTNFQSRVEFSAVIGSLNVGDEERVPTGNYQGLDENDSGIATALAGPINGSFFAGKYRQIWKLTPTGDPTRPYSALALNKVVGVLGPKAIAVGEDESGNTALYWMSHRGPYSWGLGGLKYLGKCVEDKTIGAGLNGVSLSLSASQVVSHLLWFREKRQLWCWVATAAGNTPNLVLVLNVGQSPQPFVPNDQGIPSGWSVFTGAIATSLCSVLYSRTLTPTPSLDLKPYVAQASASINIGLCDTTAFTDMGGSAFLATLTTKAYAPWGDGFSGAVMGVQVTGPSCVGFNSGIVVATYGDYGKQHVSDSCNLIQVGAETRTQARIGGAVALGAVDSVYFQVGDEGSANLNQWALDDVTVTWRREGPSVA